MLVRHKVEDYDKWKSMYDPDAANRKASGPKGACIFHNTNDPSEMIVLLKWNDVNYHPVNGVACSCAKNRATIGRLTATLALMFRAATLSAGPEKP